jgi:ATP-binding cassette, subfamily B (MDR/TAP), member 1
MIAQGIAQIAPSSSALIQASSAAAELDEVLQRTPALTSSPDAGVAAPSVKGDIAFHDLRFSYPSRPDVPVLKGISFECPANQVTALVGASGSGKSTIVALLERWYEPSQGSITLDGQKLDDYNVRWLRSQMRLVQQVSSRPTPSPMSR